MQMQLLSLHKNEAVFTHLIFVDCGIKINGVCYRDVLLKLEMLPISVQFLVTSLFSRSVNPPAMVALLQREVSAFIAPNLWPHNSPELNSVGYDAGPRLLGEGVRRWSETAFDWHVSKASSTTRSTSGFHDLVPVSMQKGDILNSLYNLYLNFVIKWRLFVTTAVVLIWKCLCLWQLSFHKVVQQHV